MKTRLILLIIGFAISFNSAFAQFNDSDVKLSIEGLSDTYAQKFKDKKQTFIDALNNSDLPSSIKPLKLDVKFEDNKGYVKLTVDFDVNKIYSETSQYKKHGNQFRAFGKGISFIFQHQLMLCLSEYKFAVAREGYSVNNQLAGFESVVSLEKSNGDILQVYAYNRTNNGYGGGGLFPYYFFSTINMKIGGKNYSTECGNMKTLNDMKMFFVKELEGLDGQKTGAYYFCKFFNIPVD